MTSSLPEFRYTEQVLRGDRADTVTAARFETDLRSHAGGAGAVSVRVRAEAQAAGYAAGWAQGQREAETVARAQRERIAAETARVADEAAAAVAQALAAVAESAAGLERQLAPAAAELEDLIVRTAFALAESIVGRELAVAGAPGHDAVRRALALAPIGRPVTVRLHPTDHRVLASGEPGAVEVVIDRRSITLVADSTLEPGDAVAHTDASTIDARIGAALARTREVLGL